MRHIALLFITIFMLTLSALSHAKMDPSTTTTTNPTDYKTAIFAGGCFWCMEKPFEKHDGVIEAVSGYTGGHVDNPTYEQVSKGGTGHYEAVKITYDPAKISYKDLLEIFWKNIDPFNPNGQFCDIGKQYRAAIFYRTEEERLQAEISKREVEEKFAQPVDTQILRASMFYDAEDYHQDYYKKNPIRYTFYRSRCGRDDRLEEVWDNK